VQFPRVLSAYTFRRGRRFHLLRNGPLRASIWHPERLSLLELHGTLMSLKMHRTSAKHLKPTNPFYRLAESEPEDPSFEKEELAEIHNYYRRLEALILDCLRTGEFRLAWSIICAEERTTHSSRMHTEQAGLACIRGLEAAVDGVGFL
jgi:hypothetical protein